MPLSKVYWLARDKIKTTYNINAVRVQSLAAFFSSKLYIPNAVTSDKSHIFAIEKWDFTQSIE